VIHRLGSRARDTGHAAALRRVAFGCLALSSLAAPWRAAAQEESANQVDPLPRAALLTTSRIKLGPEAERDAAFDTEVYDTLERLQLVEVVSRPALDLEAIQLSIDCVGETPKCLQAVARQTRTALLLAPSIERRDGEIVLTILYFDARAGGELRRVTRSHPGDELSAESLAEVPAMLRELLRAPEQEARAGADPDPGATTDDAALGAGSDVPGGGEVSLGPLLLALVGVSALGGAVGLGLTAHETQADYDKLVVTNPKQAETASDKLDQGKLQAIGANVLFAVAGAALLGSAVWLAADLSSDGEPASELVVAPELGPGRAGLTLRGAWGGPQ